MTEEARSRYFDELSICLSRNGFTTQKPEEGRLPVEQDGVPLCRVDENGTVYWAVDAGGKYESAKRDFATRSGLVRSCQVFTTEQLTEAYRSIRETLDNSEHITDQRRNILEETAGQIEQCVSDLQERVCMSNQRELEHEMQLGGMSV